MCSKHVKAWNKLIVKQKFCASSWLIIEINILRCTVSKTSTPICHTNFTCSPTPYLRGVFILEHKCAGREYLNNMYSLFQNTKAKSDVTPKTPPLKGLQIPKSNSEMFSGSFSSALCLHTEHCNQNSWCNVFEPNKNWHPSSVQP